ncbi:MAG: hypothetical protein EOM23_10985 [Candidatus Moranbacteria bacterium]|nr:hypothetical protein [Candidatus Moranbacteria bacterium]
MLRIQNFIESILLYTLKSKNTKKIRSQGFAHDYGKKWHNGIQELPESYHQSHVVRPPPILGSDLKIFPTKEAGQVVYCQRNTAIYFYSDLFRTTEAKG